MVTYMKYILIYQDTNNYLPETGVTVRYPDINDDLSETGFNMSRYQ